MRASSSANTATQVRQLGLAVGDFIQGKTIYLAGWEESCLQILWIGHKAVVFHEWRRTSNVPDWTDCGEVASWDLSWRDWQKVTACPSRTTS